MDIISKMFLPPTCLICSKEGLSLCSSCFSQIEYLDTSYCVVCDMPSVEGETHLQCQNGLFPNKIISAFSYEGNIRICIKRAKYSSRLYSVLGFLTERALVYIQKQGVLFDEHLVVPVPLNSKKYKNRGFNQAEIISKKVSKELGLKHSNKGLIRIKDTKAQYSKGKKGRFENLQNAFRADPALVEGKNILLVDDICTTGATLLECSKTLLAVGAKSVSCFTLCKKK